MIQRLQRMTPLRDHVVRREIRSTLHVFNNTQTSTCSSSLTLEPVRHVLYFLENKNCV